jgi:hypothetical protein
MELRCKVFRFAQPAELEQAINRFLDEELAEGEVQLEEITQSGGPEGVTVVLWYSTSEGALDELEEGPEEVDAEDEEPLPLPRELA